MRPFFLAVASTLVKMAQEEAAAPTYFADDDFPTTTSIPSKQQILQQAAKQAGNATLTLRTWFDQLEFANKCILVEVVLLAVLVMLILLCWNKYKIYLQDLDAKVSSKED